MTGHRLVIRPLSPEHWTVSYEGTPPRCQSIGPQTEARAEAVNHARQFGESTIQVFELDGGEHDEHAEAVLHGRAARRSGRHFGLATTIRGARRSPASRSRRLRGARTRAADLAGLDAEERVETFVQQYPPRVVLTAAMTGAAYLFATRRHT